MYTRSITFSLRQLLLALPINYTLMLSPISHADPIANAASQANVSGAAAWLNSEPLTPASLQGKVVLVDFWTYGCSNCLNALPSVKGWAEKYKAQGLIVIGVHTPEFAYEKELSNVQRSVRDLGITYPVALDNNYTIWRAFHNQYWPSQYLIDRTGHILYIHAGEGDYAQIELAIQQLLTDKMTDRSLNHPTSY